MKLNNKPLIKLQLCTALLGVILSVPLWAQTTAVGTTQGQFSVSPSGAATYRIPITVPPGISGMEPEISMVYSSHGGPSVYGYGWNLSGNSTISRCSKTIAQDGIVDGIDLDDEDALCLDGQRLILSAGSYAAAGSTYRTEIEKFGRITALNDISVRNGGFKVEGKNGITKYYGQSAEATKEGIVRVTQDSEQFVPYLWVINRMTDGNPPILNLSQK